MQKKLRIVFMGTPDFAVETLKTLVYSNHEVVGVITAPDKPAGRGKLMQPSAVKIFAEQVGLRNILQPENLKAPEFIENLKSLGADLQIVVAFRMLPEIVWSMPPLGTVNLHASLLPDYRGAAPINWAIINGEKQTGVTTFFIEKDIDTGKIIFNEKIEIEQNTTSGELHDILMVRGARLVQKTVEAIAVGNCPSISQNELLSSIKISPAPKIFKEHCKINWGQPPKVIYDFVRGLSPYPTAWTEFRLNGNSITVKIYFTSFNESKHNKRIGELISDGKTFLQVAVYDGYISIENLQQAGKKRMPISEFIRGIKNIAEYSLTL